jgi:hypothetical protein
MFHVQPGLETRDAVWFCTTSAETYDGFWPETAGKKGEVDDGQEKTKSLDLPLRPCN